MPIYKPLYPGKIVKGLLADSEYACLSVKELAEKLGVSGSAIYGLLNGHLRITSNMARRLTKLFTNTSAEFWMNLQRDCDSFLDLN